MATQDDIALQKEYLKIQERIKKEGENYVLVEREKQIIIQAINKGLVETQKLVYDTVEKVHEEYALRQKVNEVLLEQAGTTKQFTEYAHESYRLAIREADITANTLTQEIKKLEAKQDLNATDEEALEILKAKLRIAMDARELGTDELKASSDLAKSHEMIVGLLGLKVKFEESRIGKMTKQASVLKNNVKEQGLFVARMRDTFSVSNLVASVFDKIFESTVAMAARFNSATAEFNKVTGAGGKYNEVIDRARLGTTRFGVGLTEANNAASALFVGFSNFTVVSEEMRESLIRNVAILNELGMASDVVVKNMNVLVKAVGMTEQAALDMQLKLGKIDIGLTPGQMAQDLQTALPVFVRFGKVVGERVFMQLEKQVKQTGMAMQELLGIAGQFDTFEGAAQVAGKLNAVLGGNLLNSTELLLASEGDRIKMLQNTIRLSGRNWESMGRLEKQMIANIATQGDVIKAGQLFQRQTAQQIAQQQELDKRTQATQSATKQLTMVMENFAMMVKPLAEGLNAVLGVMLLIADKAPWLTTGIKYLTIAWAGWKAILISSRIAAIAWGAITSKVILGSLAKIGAGFTTTSAGIATTVAATGSALAAGSVGWIAFGIAVALIGGGIYLAATGLGNFVSAFAGMDAGNILAIAAAIGLFGLSLQSLFLVMATPFSVAAQFGLLMLSLTFAAIAISITIAANAMTGLIKALGLLRSNQLNSLASAMRAFGDVIKNIDTDKTVNFKTNLDQIGTAIHSLDMARLTLFKDSIGAFTLNLTKLNAGKAKVFDDVTQSYTNVIQVVDGADSSRLENAAQIANALAHASMARTSVTVTPTIGGGGGLETLTLNVNLDGKPITQKIYKLASLSRPSAIINANVESVG
jgi:hypothetical protein